MLGTRPNSMRYAVLENVVRILQMLDPRTSIWLFIGNRINYDENSVNAVVF